MAPALERGWGLLFSGSGERAHLPSSIHVFLGLYVDSDGEVCRRHGCKLPLW
jgi:hypothetical protein